MQQQTNRLFETSNLTKTCFPDPRTQSNRFHLGVIAFSAFEDQHAIILLGNLIAGASEKPDAVKQQGTMMLLGFSAKCVGAIAVPLVDVSHLDSRKYVKQYYRFRLNFHLLHSVASL